MAHLMEHPLHGLHHAMDGDVAEMEKNGWKKINVHPAIKKAYELSNKNKETVIIQTQDKAKPGRPPKYNKEGEVNVHGSDYNQ